MESEVDAMSFVSILYHMRRVETSAKSGKEEEVSGVSGGKNDGKTPGESQ